jgi:hypothetical protein
MAINLAGTVKQLNELRQEYNGSLKLFEAALRVKNASEVESAYKDVALQLQSAGEIINNRDKDGAAAARDAGFIAINIVEKVIPKIKQFGFEQNRGFEPSVDLQHETREVAEQVLFDLSGRKDFPQRLVAAKLFDEVSTINRTPDVSEMRAAELRYHESDRAGDRSVRAMPESQKNEGMSAADMVNSLSAPLPMEPILKHIGKGTREGEVLKELEMKGKQEVSSSGKASPVSEPVAKASSIANLGRSSEISVGQC